MGRHPCPVSPSIVDDIVEVDWLVVVLPLSVVLSYPLTSITVGQAYVTDG
jgi:hypothetical protein